MKTLKKYSDRIILIATIFLLLFFGYRKIGSLNNRIKGQLLAAEIFTEEVHIQRNKNGQLEAEKRSQNLTIKDLKEYGDQVGQNNEKLKKKVGSLKNLVSNLEGALATAGDGQVQLEPDTIRIKGDSVNYFLGHTFEWTNNYLTLNGTLDQDLKMDFKYQYKSDFGITTYWKRPSLFKRKELMVNMLMTDPNARATELNSVVIKPDPPKFYQTTGFKIGIGVVGGFLLAK